MSAAMVYGFVFTVTRYQSGEAIPREHPAYREPSDGRIVWALNREAWRDAPPEVAATFLPAGDAARAHMLELQRLAACGELEPAAAVPA
jgi:hypothetical protein